jgi:hypothetical protein
MNVPEPKAKDLAIAPENAFTTSGALGRAAAAPAPQGPGSGATAVEDAAGAKAAAIVVAQESAQQESRLEAQAALGVLKTDILAYGADTATNATAAEDAKFGLARVEQQAAPTLEEKQRQAMAVLTNYYAREQSSSPAGKEFYYSTIRSQSFVNSAAPNLLLNRFEVIQTPPSIKIIDEDGSVYTGKLGQATLLLTRDKEEAARRYGNAPELSNESFAPQALFSVQGFNKKLGQEVQISGGLASLPQNEIKNQNVSAGVFRKVLSPRAASQANSLMRNQTSAEANGAAAKIVGSALVGGTNRFQFEAESAAPSGPAQNRIP